jgi:hypothetical protein
MSQEMAIFPLVGLRYRRIIAGRTEGITWDDPGDNSNFWIQGGGGLDFGVSGGVFVRGQLLYGIGFASKADRDFVKDAKDSYGLSNAKTSLHHGLEIGLGVGYRF